MPRTDANHHGLLLMNKPSGLTSHDLVDRVRKVIRQRQIGHTGTLDPLATGLMVLCLGRATKLAQFFAHLDKAYTATVVMGIETPTGDRETLNPELPHVDVPVLSSADVDRHLEPFRGTYDQEVPAYSAVQVNGQRLYDAARKGELPESLPVRSVRISELSLTELDIPRLRLEIRCSSGTYIRSLVRDLGRSIGCGAYLDRLERTSIGQFELGDALSIEQVDDYHSDGTLAGRLVAAEQVLPFGAVIVRPEFSRSVAQGRDILAESIVGTEPPIQSGEPVLVKTSEGAPLAVARALYDRDSITTADHEGRVVSYIRVLV